MDRIDAMKGFARAARRLKVSPATVTRQVAGLEERLGVELLRRSTRSVTLTEAGARFLGQARGILDSVATAERATAAARPEPAGRFVLTAPLTFGRLEVAPLLSRFLAKYPAVRAELVLV